MIMVRITVKLGSNQDEIRFRIKVRIKVRFSIAIITNGLNLFIVRMLLDLFLPFFPGFMLPSSSS